MKVVVVESPAKAKTINKYLGKDYTVLASFGHVRDLPSKDGSVDPEQEFAMHYSVPKESEKHITAIIKALKDADTLYLATDPDREGEAISWHVLEEIKKRNKLGKIDVKRVEFHEITKTAIQKAIAHPRDLSMDLVNAQQARRALDYLVGFNLSPLLWRKVRPGLSAGRVQSVALRMICDREAEIEAFKAEEYWSIDGLFATTKNEPLTGRLYTLNGDKVEKFSLTSQTQADAAVKALQAGTYSVAKVEQKDVSRRAAPPFTTSTLQQEASRKLGFTTRKTMNLAQRLYEAGHITYMRTDSVTLSNDALANLRGTIAKVYGGDYVPESPNFYKNKTKNAQEAHEAVRPTDSGKLPNDLKGELEADQAKLYELIWKRTVASQMAPAKLAQTSLTLATADGKQAFRASGSVITFPGFLKVYREGLDDNQSDDLDEAVLPQVAEGDKLSLKELKPEQHFTEPPPRYSDASLVKALEERGIGRPSTYASIVSTLLDRGYVRNEKRRFFPEDVGRIVNKFLVEHFATYVDYDFTANLEDDLDAVSRGERGWKPLLGDFWSPFKSTVDEKMTSVKKSDVTSERTGETCPQCKEGELIIRLGRYGRFKGCSRYPECRYIENLPGNTAGGDAASAAPKAEPKDTGFTCPKCSTGKIMEKVSRRGKVFYGCGSYPKCDFAFWDKPVAKPCPQCGASYTAEKDTKRQGTIRKCVVPDCGWQDPPATAKDSAKPAAATKAPAKKAAPKKPAAKKKAPAKKTSAKGKAATKAS
ncbi:MAG: type I DNA topoisomerase [Proteobacteria bacterium]|nr:type I DNA topoisomerase [Pseudomonadota bacterium]